MSGLLRKTRLTQNLENSAQWFPIKKNRNVMGRECSYRFAEQMGPKLGSLNGGVDLGGREDTAGACCSPALKSSTAPHSLQNKVSTLELGIQGPSKTLVGSGHSLLPFILLSSQQMCVESLLGARHDSRDWEC